MGKRTVIRELYHVREALPSFKLLYAGSRSLRFGEQASPSAWLDLREEIRDDVEHFRCGSDRCMREFWRTIRLSIVIGRHSDARVLKARNVRSMRNALIDYDALSYRLARDITSTTSHHPVSVIFSSQQWTGIEAGVGCCIHALERASMAVLSLMDRNVYSPDINSSSGVSVDTHRQSRCKSPLSKLLDSS